MSVQCDAMQDAYVWVRSEREKLEGRGDGKGRKRRKGDEASGPPDATSIIFSQDQDRCRK